MPCGQTSFLAKQIEVKMSGLLGGALFVWQVGSLPLWALVIWVDVVGKYWTPFVEEESISWDYLYVAGYRSGSFAAIFLDIIWKC